MLKAVYKAVKNAKVIIASSVALITMRLMARFDYWVLIFGDATPLISVDQKALLASICRIRMGRMYMEICSPHTNEILNLGTDESINQLEKENVLTSLFSMYEFFPENHSFKKPYFACIINVLLTLFFINKTGFNFALGLLLRLLKNGSITLQTYREISSQLIINGISLIEMDIV